MGFIIKGDVDTPLFTRLSKNYFIFNTHFFVNNLSHNTLKNMIRDGSIGKVDLYNLKQISNIINPFTVLALIYYSVDITSTPLLKNYYYLKKISSKKEIEEFFVNSHNSFSTVFVLYRGQNNVYHIIFNHIPHIEKIVVRHPTGSDIVKFKNQVINLGDVSFITVKNGAELLEYLQFSGIVLNNKILSESVNAPYNTWFTYVNSVGVYNTYSANTRTLIQIPVTTKTYDCNKLDINSIRHAEVGFTLVKENKLFLLYDDEVKCFNVNNWDFLHHLPHRLKKRLFNSKWSRDLRFLKHYPEINIITPL